MQNVHFPTQNDFGVVLNAYNVLIIRQYPKCELSKKERLGTNGGQTHGNYDTTICKCVLKRY